MFSEESGFEKRLLAAQWSVKQSYIKDLEIDDITASKLMNAAKLELIKISKSCLQIHSKLPKVPFKYFMIQGKCNRISQFSFSYK